MKEKFIPYTKKKYSITSDGIVYSHYRYLNNGNKHYNKSILSIYNQGTHGVVKIQYDKWSETNLPKVTFVVTLMKNAFKLKQPDEHHHYSLKHINNNVLDCSLDNLEWKIKCESDVNFYPQPYYNNQGDITSKCCSNCGEIQNINVFYFKKAIREGERRTYTNQCKKCRHKQTWITIKSNPDRLAKYKLEQSISRKSKHRRETLNTYMRKRHSKNAIEINDAYISYCVKVPARELTPELKELTRKRITLKRKLENHGNKEN
jgi:hypothetical protein